MKNNKIIMSTMSGLKVKLSFLKLPVKLINLVSPSIMKINYTTARSPVYILAKRPSIFSRTSQFISPIQNRFFSQKNLFFMNRVKNNGLINMIDSSLAEIEKKLKELQKKRVHLDVDIARTNAHRAILANIENDEEATESDQEIISANKRIYPKYFEKEAESDPEASNTSEYKERKQAGQVLTDLKRKRRDNCAATYGFKIQANGLYSLKRQKLSEIEGSNQTSQQINKTPGDFIDNLPTEHNPMDDIGGGD